MSRDNDGDHGEPVEVSEREQGEAEYRFESAEREARRLYGGGGDVAKMTDAEFTALQITVESERQEWHRLNDIADKQWRRFSVANDALDAEKQARMIDRIVAERLKGASDER